MTDDNKRQGPFKINYKDGYIEFAGVPKLSREGIAFYDAPEAVTFHLNSAYAKGRKAERERCARIAESWLDRSVGELIAEKIRGGQDEK